MFLILFFTGYFSPDLTVSEQDIYDTTCKFDLVSYTLGKIGEDNDNSFCENITFFILFYFIGTFQNV